MVEKPLSRHTFNRINDSMRVLWTRVLTEHFGAEIKIGEWDDLPPGQVWCIKGDTCVGENTVIEREILSFLFSSPEYGNPELDKDRFYRINEQLYDELANLIESPACYTIRQFLADTLYCDGETNMVPYSIAIWARLKDARGHRHKFGDGLLGFSVNSADPKCYQIDGIGHSPSTGHFTHVPRAFLSHATEDKARIRDVIVEIENAGIITWMDEAELRPGDSLIDKIGSALETTDVVYAFISSVSIESRWVQKELNVAGAFEVQGVRIRVVPILLDRVLLPPLLADKLYVDLSHQCNFLNSCAKLLRAGDARFWRMRDLKTYKEAVALESQLKGWHLPDLHQARDARTCMIFSELTGFNDAMWLRASTPRAKKRALVGTKTQAIDSGDSAKLQCVFVPD